ncbi:thermonuclease family protein [Candidatus Saccharibacteria bacterium]|nr:thermonuclease family protein [Candidatus Saccharibacteria bacterium]MCB9821435.1 thermonuclease family protein [Candidatus Nomurabacteria bacterium]
MKTTKQLKKLIYKLLLALLVICLTYVVDHVSRATLGQDIASSDTYLVLNIYDGDTIEVLMDGTPEKVRFIGVDTPETHKPNTPVQCYGPEASDFTTSLLTGQRVRLLADASSSNRDIYGRLLRYVVRASDDLDVNLELIRQGYSKAYLVFPHGRSQEFRDASASAEAARVGLWSACD